AAHPGGEVSARRPEDHDRAAGHVLTAVIAHAFDDGDRAAVSHGEALAPATGEEGLAARGSVEARVADDDVLVGLEGRPRRRLHDEHTARETFADVVVRVAFEDEEHPPRREGAEALPGGSRALDDDGPVTQALRAMLSSALAGEASAERAVGVRQRDLNLTRLAVLDAEMRA